MIKKNSIINDDCFNVFPKIEPKSIDMVLVDLPYGQTACNWDIEIDLNEMWKQLKLICKENCQYIFFTTTKFGYKIIHSNPNWFRYDLVWEKPSSVGYLSANKMPLRNHEMMYIFKSPKAGVYNPQKTEGKPYKKLGDVRKNKSVYGELEALTQINKTGQRHPKSVLTNIEITDEEAPKTTIIKENYDKEKLHRTQKPVKLCEWLIKSYSNENDLVLDFCMGSGSSIVACKNTNRDYIGVEMNKDIFEIAKKRLN